MSSKQTAVEWLVIELNQMINVIPMEKWDVIRDIVQEAKEMEKAQIINTFKDAQVLHTMNDQMRGEQYFNETYNL